MSIISYALPGTAHTVSAAVVAGLAFYVFRVHGSESTDIFTLAAKVEQTQREYRTSGKTILTILRRYIVAYAILTGLLAAALTSLQFGDAINIPTAIIYGTLGPFVLRDAVGARLGRRATNSIDSTITGIVRPIEKYKEELENIRQEEMSSEATVTATKSKRDKAVPAKHHTEEVSAIPERQSGARKTPY